jgi:hypothetical protein
LRGAAAAAALLIAVPANRAPAETAAALSTPAAEPSQAARELTPEAACEQIRAAMRALAKTERAQALALDLAAGGGTSAIVETRLTALLDRTNDLRTVLRRVRLSTAAGDPYTEQCVRNGFRSLVDAEKLSSDVEEVLLGNQGRAHAFGAPPHASATATPRDSTRDAPSPVPAR